MFLLSKFLLSKTDHSTHLWRRVCHTCILPGCFLWFWSQWQNSGTFYFALSWANYSLLQWISASRWRVRWYLGHRFWVSIFCWAKRSKPCKIQAETLMNSLVTAVERNSSRFADSPPAQLLLYCSSSHSTETYSSTWWAFLVCFDVYIVCLHCHVHCPRKVRWVVLTRAARIILASGVDRRELASYPLPVQTAGEESAQQKRQSLW